MEAYIRFIIRNRVATLAVIGLVTVLGAASMSRGVIATTLGALFLGESQDYIHYREVRVPQFGSDGHIMMAFEEPEFLTSDRIEGLETAVARIQDMPDVAHVDSILNVRRVSGDRKNFNVSAYSDAILKGRQTAAGFVEELRSDPLARGLVISEDGRHFAVVVELKFDESRPAEAGPIILGEIRGILSDAGFEESGVHAAGIMVALSEVMHQTVFSMSRLLPAVMLVLLLVVFLLFGRLWPMVVTGVVGIISVIWTMGLAVALSRNVNVLLAMVPAVITTVAFSDVIHLCSSYLLELAQGKSKEEAIVKSGTDVGKACLLTSLTTFAGFVTLSFVPTPVFRQLGVVLGFGVAGALLLAMTLVPIMFSLMPRPKPWRTDSRSFANNFLDRILAGTERLTSARPWWVIASFVVLLGVSCVGISEMTIDTDLTKRLAGDNTVRVDGRYFSEHFSGTSSLELYVEADEEGGLLDPELFARIAAFQDSLEAAPGVGQVMSLVDLVRSIHRVMSVAGEEHSMPRTRKNLADYLLLLEMSDKDDELERFIDFERRTMRLVVRLPEQGVRETHEIGLMALEMAGPIEELGGKVEANGTIYLIGRCLDSVIEGQRRGLAMAFLMIAIMMIIGLGSLRAGLWAMVPNALPILALGGLLGFFWDAVDSDNLAIAMMAIGIGVDDTIHFLMRYKLESSRGDGIEAALRRTLHFSGRAIVITTLVLMAGFAPLAASDYLPIRNMGILLPYTLFVALMADILLVPSLARVGLFKFRDARSDRS